MRDDKEQLIRDFEKVYMAHYKAPLEEKREAMKKALQEVWDRRRRDKEAKQQQDKKR
jgi:hypothetical protein